MKQKTTMLFLAAAMAALILDSRCAAGSALSALELCIKTLIPTLFPLFVVSSMLVPNLKSARIPGLSRLLGIPDGSEGIFLLGCAGGFPVGAACIAQAVESGGLRKRDANRMLGFCSFCGPSFLFGVIGAVLSPGDALALFTIQLETAVLTAALWPGRSDSAYHPGTESVSLTDAVRRAISAMSSVCAWVVLAGVVAGFGQRWLFPLLPDGMAVLLTGLMELTTGVFSLSSVRAEHWFLLCAVFVCFGGVSVLLQIRGLAAPAGLEMGACIGQKTVQALLGAALALGYQRLGPGALLVIPGLIVGKIAVEIPGMMVYNNRRKEGI